MKKVFTLIVFLILIYQIQFAIFPFGVHIFLGSIGILIAFINHYFKNNFSYTLKGKYNAFEILNYFIPCLIISVISMVLNNSDDYHFIKYGIGALFSFYSFYFLAFLFAYSYETISVHIIIQYFIISQIIYLSISLACFYNPSLYEWIVHHTRLDKIALDTIDQLKGRRLMGIGINFFSSGVVSGLVLILISLYMYFYKLNVWKIIALLLSFISIFIVGMMVARTTIIGFVFACIIILLSFIRKKDGRKSLIWGIIITIITVFSLKDYYSILMNSDDEIELLSSFGFEAFENFDSTGYFTTSSVESMRQHYSIMPDNIKTWLIGDAMWNSNNGYYMKTDIGYSRNIFYFGIIGLISFLYFHFIFIKKTILDNSFKSIVALIVLFAYFIVINLKGVSDLYYSLLIFFFATPLKKELNFKL